MIAETGLQFANIEELQRRELAIFGEYTKICERNKLKYYLNAGTLLGAVRHRGFIPWDDDIDICMPRTDYERFLRVANDQLPKNMHAVYYKNQKPEDHPQYSCQIYDLNMPLVQKIAEHPRRTYAWIDIFPLDGMPNNVLVRKIHGWHLLYRRVRIQMCMMERNVNMHKNRPWYERWMIFLIKKTKLGSRSDPWRQMEKLDRVLIRYSESKSDYWINFMGAYKLKETFPSSWYGKGKEFMFEDIQVIGPEKEDKILSALYGDYMTPRKPGIIDESHLLYVEEKSNVD